MLFHFKNRQVFLAHPSTKFNRELPSSVGDEKGGRTHKMIGTQG